MYTFSGRCTNPCYSMLTIKTDRWKEIYLFICLFVEDLFFKKQFLQVTNNVKGIFKIQVN